ncbi:hypothetical protein BD410DRAFT_793171 [Rickenella mellea]|uniref:DUF6534 domain-containing protein n=1 Tax=Rickenella mellea TaxID=50990 RepID=A0A4Y7PTV6_9AGAM|nr:hypothetical protein BD410DRAFT_793171 [Rickenella mellea]
MSPSVMDLNLGALEIGTLISSVLFGVTTVQVYMYWNRRFNDRVAIQGLVATVWTCEAVHTAFLWIYLYHLTVTFYGVPAKLAESHWTLNMSGFFDGFIGAVVQSYFAYRVLIVSGKWPISLISWTGSLLQCTGTFAVTALGFLTTLEQFAEKYGWLVKGVLVLDVIVDIINTTALCYYLSKGRTGFHSTDRMIDTIILWTVETGLLTTIAALTMLIFDISLGTTAMWIGVSLFYAKLYSNSLLAALNGRDILRGKGVSTFDTTSAGTRRLEISVVREREMEMGVLPNSAYGKENSVDTKPVEYSPRF